MKARLFFLGLITMVFYHSVFAQVGVGNTNPQAVLDISASNSVTPANSDGILIPRMGSFPSAPGAARDGMLVFYTGAGADGKGFYYWDQPTISWISISGTKRIDDLLDGKSDSDGTNDGSSIFLGINSGAADDSSNNQNIGIGYQSLQDNTSGENNTAIGYQALNNNVDGSQNTAVGLSSLINNNTGSNNTAIGYGALLANQGGFDNTAVGFGALGNNASSAYNTSMGVQSLAGNTGASNTAFGYRALYSNGTGTRNVSIGLQSLNFNLTGNDNVAIGYRSGYTSTGSGNVFIGTQSGNGATGNNKLFIDNSNTATPLIYGEFDNDILRLSADVSIGTTNPDNSSVLDITSSNKGLLIPRMTVSDRLAISSPATGLMVYQTNDVSGLYFYDGTSWDRMLKESRDPVPTGAIFSFPVQTPPSGYLVCDGSAINRTTYDDLFAILGTNYGAGNGSTTFNLPDYRGQFLRGHDNGVGNDPDAATRQDRGDGTTGDNVGTRQNHEMESHLHQIDAPVTASNVSGNHSHSTSSVNANTNAAGNHNHTTSSTSVNTNASGNHNHRIRGDETNISSSGVFGGSDFEVDDTGNSGSDYHDTSTEGNHNHTVTIPSLYTNSTGNHNHTVIIPALSTNNTGDHVHTTDIPVFDSSTTGSTENRPINTTVIYCIKY